ncbi:hypothetical protein [Sphingomonas sp. GB1N7]|uniref:hypothetical protein n=1 Tax=Parasphingomonas caseinilytica TaxID=3096158 RepID=UPI002FC95893
MSDPKTSETPNEIVAAARHHQAAKERAGAKDVKKDGKNWPIGAIGLGVGIGSAAVAAAMIFAGRNKKD